MLLMEKNKPQRLEALQILRAIAAAMVVFVHALSTFNEKIDGAALLGFNYGFGELGVKLFFCISGFIIFSSSHALNSGWNSVSYFFRRRLIRIAPLYWCATIIYALKLSLQGYAPAVDALIFSLSFIPYLNDVGLMRPILGVGWTLNYEMFFYLIISAVLFFPRAWRFVLIMGVMTLLVWMRYAGIIGLSSSFWGNALYLLSDTYLLFFVLGMFVVPISKLHIFSKIPKMRWEATCIVILLIIIFLVLSSVEYSLLPVELLFLEIIACGLCVLLCVVAECTGVTNEPGFLQRMAILAGDGSYSTYLTHGFVMGPVARVLGVFPGYMSILFFSLSMVVICSAVGMIVFKSLEHPMLLKMNSKWGGR